MSFKDNFNSHLADILSGLGDEVEYVTEAGTYNINGIFENEYFEIPSDMSVGVVGSQPKLTIKTSDIPNANTDDEVFVDGNNYRVVSIHPSGDGVTTLILERV
jgi:hypothetical protein